MLCVYAGVRVLQLLQWTQRLSALVSMQQFELAMACGVQTLHAAGGSPAVAWPADGLSATRAEAGQRLIAILLGYVDAELDRTQSMPDSSETSVRVRPIFAN